ncbi:MAG: hypothetical protein Q9205_005344 [Flavoplaca limonia]
MNAGQEDGGTLEGFYAYKDTFDPDNVWVEVPKAITFVPVLDPFAPLSSPEPEDEGASQTPDTHEARIGPEETHLLSTSTEAHINGLEELTTGAIDLPSTGDTLLQDNISYPDDGFIDTYERRLDEEATAVGYPPQSQPLLATAVGNEDLVFNPGSSLSTTPNPGLETSQDVPNATHDVLSSKSQSKTDSTTAPSDADRMDLFDQTTFFGSHVPVKSISNPLLKHAACAYAAKQLGRVNGAKAIVGGICSRQATMEQWQRTDQEGWALIAAQHYDHTISLLLEALHWDQESSKCDDSENIDQRYYAPRTLDGMVNERKLRRRKFGSTQSTAKSDDVLAATAILCEYESLDASTAAWTRHLSGTKTLLDVVEVGVMPLDTPEAFPVPRKTKPSQARKAIFWNFARQDLFAAFMHECRTRLDTDDVAMWKDAGLLLDENDLVVPSNTADIDLPEEDFMREDMSGNALIWLASKLMNLICASSASSPSTQSQDHISQQWHHLTHQLQTWFNGLPETFMPSAIIPTSLHNTTHLTEVWLSIP